jgi:hypothetical protein
MFGVVKVQLHALLASARKPWAALPPSQRPQVPTDQGGSDGSRAREEGNPCAIATVVQSMAWSLYSAARILTQRNVKLAFFF